MKNVKSFLILFLIIPISLQVFAQKNESFLKKHETTFNYYPGSLMSSDFMSIDCGIEFAPFSNTYYQNIINQNKFKKQISTLSLTVRGGIIVNDLFNKANPTEINGWSARIQIKKYSKHFTYKNPIRELRAFYVAPELFLAVQSYEKNLKYYNSGLPVDSINCTLYNISDRDDFFHERINLGGYVKFGIRQNLKRLVLDFYLGIGSKSLFKEDIKIEEKVGKSLFNEFLCNEGCDNTSCFFEMIFETGIGIGFR